MWGALSSNLSPERQEPGSELWKHRKFPTPVSLGRRSPPGSNTPDDGSGVPSGTLTTVIQMLTLSPPFGQCFLKRRQNQQRPNEIANKTQLRRPVVPRRRSGSPTRGGGSNAGATVQAGSAPCACAQLPRAASEALPRMRGSPVVNPRVSNRAMLRQWRRWGLQLVVLIGLRLWRSG